MKSQKVFGPVWANIEKIQQLFPHLPPASPALFDAYLVLLRESLKDLSAQELTDVVLQYEIDPATPEHLKIYSEVQ